MYDRTKLKERDVKGDFEWRLGISGVLGLWRRGPAVVPSRNCGRTMTRQGKAGKGCMDAFERVVDYEKKLLRGFDL